MNFVADIALYGVKLRLNTMKRRAETMRKNKILWFTVKANLVALALALSALDSESIIPVIVALVALAYLGLFNYANKEREWK
jgi:hypothetical protein